MAKLSDTAQYQAAFKVLSELKGTVERDRLQTIALYLLYTADLDCPIAMFPYLGEGDPRDRAITRAFEQEWQRLHEDESE